MYPNISYISQVGPHRAYRDVVRPEIESYFGLCFERLCREGLSSIYEREGVRAAFEVGEYWSRDEQIDVVGYRQDGRVDLGECRWGRVRSLRALREEVLEKACRYPNPEGATIGLRVFTREKVPSARVPEGIRQHSLESLQGPPRAGCPASSLGSCLLTGFEASRQTLGGSGVAGLCPGRPWMTSASAVLS